MNTDSFFASKEASFFSEFIYWKIQPLNKYDCKEEFFSEDEKSKINKKINQINKIGNYDLACLHCFKKATAIFTGKWKLTDKSVTKGVSVRLLTDDFDHLTIDHISPKSKGGKNISNRQILCYTCNTKKADNSENLYEIYELCINSV